MSTPNLSGQSADRDVYYSLMTFRGDDEPAAYLGQVPLRRTDNEVVVTDQYSSSTAPAVQEGTVRYPWGDKADRVPLPATVDTTDPFSVAPMVSYFSRPYGPNASLIKPVPETVYVYQIADSEKQALSAFDCVTAQETSTDQSLDDGTELTSIERSLQWDDSVVPPTVAGEPPELADASYVVGFADGQDMHDPYTHIGASACSAPAHALRGVLSRNPLPLWSPEVTPVRQVKSFPAGEVFNNGIPVPSSDSLQ